MSSIFNVVLGCLCLYIINYIHIVCVCVSYLFVLHTSSTTMWVIHASVQTIRRKVQNIKTTFHQNNLLNHHNYELLSDDIRCISTYQIHPNPGCIKIIQNLPNPARSLGFPSEDDAFTHETHLPAVAEPWPRSSTLLGEKAVALRRGGEVHIVSAAGAVPLEKNRVFPPWGAVILLAKMGECLRIPCNSCFEVV